MDKILAYLRKYRELAAYLFWGVMTTVVSWGSYHVFTLLLREHNTMISVFGVRISVLVFIANMLSWIGAIFFAFVTNKLWVFHSKSWKKEVLFPEFGKFISARLATGVFEIVAVPFFTGLGLNQLLFKAEGMDAKIAVSVLVVLLNYIFSKRFIFKRE